MIKKIVLLAIKMSVRSSCALVLVFVPSENKPAVTTATLFHIQ